MRLYQLGYLMDSYLKYNSEFQLAICISCQCGIPSKRLMRHFSERHKATWKSHRAEPKKDIASLTLVPPDSLQHPESIHKPIDGLKIKTGWCCAEDQCCFCSTSRECMEKHYRAKHTPDATKQKAWFECHMQTLLEHPYIR